MQPASTFLLLGDGSLGGRQKRLVSGSRRLHQEEQRLRRRDNIVETTVTSAIASSDTDANPQGSYYHEAEVTFADETFTTVTTGTLLMNLTIIR